MTALRRVWRAELSGGTVNFHRAQAVVASELPTNVFWMMHDFTCPCFFFAPFFLDFSWRIIVFISKSRLSCAESHIYDTYKNFFILNM